MLWTSSIKPFLPDRDYLPVALPTTDVGVLQVLTRAGGSLRRYSRLDRVLSAGAGVPAPEIAVDQPVADASGATARTLKIGLGLNVVSSIIEALGGEAGLNVTADQASQVRYHYTKVVSDRVDLASLDGWLAGADLLPNLRNVADLFAAEQLYVVVGALKAGGLEVELLDDDNTGVEVDVPAVQAVLGATVTVSAGSQRSAKLVFTGSQPLTVAVKAAQLRFDEHGIWVNEKLRTSGEIRGLGGDYTFLTGDRLFLG
jgi:hypothetical protein